MIDIRNSVGAEGMNRREDVMTIQQALNRIPVDKGGPQQPLAVDGLNGPQLKAAIARFQLRHFRWADRRINKTGATLKKLNALLVPGAPPVTTPPLVMPTRQQVLNTPPPRQSQPPLEQADAVIAHIVSTQGEWYFNGRVMRSNERPALRRGAQVGTFDGSLTLHFADGGDITIGSNALIVLLGRTQQLVDAGPRSETQLVRGNLGASLNALAGIH